MSAAFKAGAIIAAMLMLGGCAGAPADRQCHGCRIAGQHPFKLCSDLRLEAAVGVMTGQSGTLLINEASKTLSPIHGFRGGNFIPPACPKLDSEARYIILHDLDASFGDAVWAIFNARTGQRIASSLDLGLESVPFGLVQDPAKAEVVVVCHGPGIALLVKDKSPDAGEVRRVRSGKPQRPRRCCPS